MDDIQMKLQTIAEQEKSLVFEKFGQEDAVAIGMKLYEKAKAEGKSIAFQISLNRKVIFHLNMDGCSPDNDIWLNKKENMVYRFWQSSFQTVTFAEMLGSNVFDFYALDKEQYVGAAGGFPITLKGVGCVGAISCGGQMPEQDHQIIVDVLSEYLGK